jgi:hypothetical protein
MNSPEPKSPRLTPISDNYTRLADEKTPRNIAVVSVIGLAIGGIERSHVYARTFA